MYNCSPSAKLFLFALLIGVPPNRLNAIYVFISALEHMLFSGLTGYNLKRTYQTSIPEPHHHQLMNRKYFSHQCPSYHANAPNTMCR